MSIVGTRSSQSLTEIRLFLRADTAEELVRLQFNNNILLERSCSYTDFSQSQDGSWYCWFLFPMMDLPQEVLENPEKLSEMAADPKFMGVP